MSKLRVGVVRGGPSNEYPVSLKTGENVLRNLDRDKYTPVDILLSKHGDWYMNGVRSDFPTIAHHVDVIWNALHGAYGEDGKVQQLFDSYQIPYTGSGSVSSAVGMHKELAKARFGAAGLKTPKGEVLALDEDPEEAAFRIFRSSHLPLIVKPASGGSSLGTKVARTYDELRSAIASASVYGDVLIEEFVDGVEATCAVLDAGAPDAHFVLFPIEIAPPSHKTFFDYDAKYSGESDEICPGRFSLATHAKLRDLAIAAHQSIGARHYSRSDFIISPTKGIYILEINTLPGLTEHSLLPKALKTSGVELSDFLDHVIGLATVN